MRRKREPVDLHRFQAERGLASDTPREMLASLIGVTGDLINMLPPEARREGHRRAREEIAGGADDLTFRRGLKALDRRPRDERLATWARGMSAGLMGALLTFVHEPMPDEGRALLFQIYFDVGHALRFASKALLDGAFDNPRSTRRRRFIEFTVRLHTFAHAVRAAMRSSRQ